MDYIPFLGLYVDFTPFGDYIVVKSTFFVNNFHFNICDYE